MRPALRAMTLTERMGYMLACVATDNKDMPAAQAEVEDVLGEMNDAQLRELRDAADRLADAAGLRIVNPIEGIDIPTAEEQNLSNMRQDALDAIADAWDPTTKANLTMRRLIERAKDNLRVDWPELHRAVAALVGTLH